jgi:hypothetical protein
VNGTVLVVCVETMVEERKCIKENSGLFLFRTSWLRKSHFGDMKNSILV